MPTSPLDLGLSDREIVLALMAARDKARAGILPFTAYTHHDYRINWHHKLIANRIDKFVRGEIKRLIVAAPPRTGKSEIVSRRMPAFIFGHNPNAKIISTSYSADLATAMSRSVQGIMLSPEYRELFPKTTLSGDKSAGVLASAQNWKRSADEFEIVGYRGYYKCAGVGGGITGRGGDFLLIDDPIKSREDANSAVKREKLWDWYRDDLKTRLDGDGGILVMATRWHVDDLSGRLLKQMLEDEDGEQWELLSLPARLDEPGHPEDPRQIGEPLWPWFYAGKKDDLTYQEQVTKSLEALRLWEKTNPLGFAALAQQSPTIREGNLFPVDRIQIVRPQDLHHVYQKRLQTVRYWDNAGSRDSGCYTAGAKISRLADGRFLIEHMERFQLAAVEREQRKLRTAQIDGHTCEIWIEQEPGSSGKDVGEATVRMLAGFIAKLDRVSGDKVFRAEPLAAQVQAGNVLMMEGPWNRDLLDELAVWPHGKYLDQGDALAGAFAKVSDDSYDLAGMSKL